MSAGPSSTPFSAPAHTTYPTSLVLEGEGTARELGDALTSNRRTLHQYFHENGIRSCQILMGVTHLHPGSMWNTMPAHTHDRRTECYLYFDVPADARIIHLHGPPAETRHFIVADRQALISPSWSLHAGVGTAAYSFVWAMAGENQSFDDMDPGTCHRDALNRRATGRQSPVPVVLAYFSLRSPSPSAELSTTVPRTPSPYQSLGIRLDYDHANRRITVSAMEACVLNRVRRGTCPLGTHVLTIDIA